MTRLRKASGLAILLVATPAFSQQRTEDECVRRHPNRTAAVEIVSCTFDSSGARMALKRALHRLLTTVPAERRAQLLRSQATWATARDAQCAYEAGGFGGSTGNSSDIIACVADSNRARAKWLIDDVDRWKD
jgi:uncharacterized protein YecT (DUF1311 family)